MDPRDSIDPREALASGSIEQASGMGLAGSAPAEWYDATWNPTGGCSPVSPGCEHCKALQTVSKLARIGGKGGARYTGLTAMGPSGLQWAGEIRLRADRLRAYYTDPQTPTRRAASRARSGSTRGHCPICGREFSVEDQERIGRIRDLLQMPASQRWASFEPLLGPVRPDAVPVGEGYIDALFGGFYRLDGRGRRVPISGSAWRPLDWVVGGGEIGPGARPSDPDWVRGLRDGCVAAGLPFLSSNGASGRRPQTTGSTTGWRAFGAAPRAV